MDNNQAPTSSGSPFAWIVVLIVVAFLALGVWWIMSTGILAPAEEGDTDITIEQEAPDIDIVVPDGSSETTN
jgi:hypothetical protein